MIRQYKLTSERFEQLKNELTYLRTVREKEVADQIKEARSFGDLSENSEYDEAKNEQGKVFSRITELENILANAVLISEDSIDLNSVFTGCRVKVEDREDGAVEEYQIVGSQEADPMKHRISDESPFGKALLGKKIGEVANVDAPAGILKYAILDISRL